VTATIAPTAREPRFPNYLQLRQPVPRGVWRVAQCAAVAVAVGLLVCLVVAPRTGLIAWWLYILPVLPLRFVLAPGVWRNVCPMATLNQVPRLLGFTRGGSLPGWLRRHGYLVGVALYFGFISMRAPLLDHNGPALAVLMALALVLAFVGGVLYKGKSGWCGTICPLLPIQKLYGQTPALVVPNAHCETCLGCQKNCYDFQPTDRHAGRRERSGSRLGELPADLRRDLPGVRDRVLHRDQAPVVLVRPAATARDAPPGDTRTVCFDAGGPTVAAKPNATLLDIAERSRLPIEAGCRMGACGADPVRITDGMDGLSPLGDDERSTLRRLGLAEDCHRMACCARVKGDVGVSLTLDRTRKAVAAAAPAVGFDPAVRRVVVIGNGIAGITAADHVRRSHPDCATTSSPTSCIPSTTAWAFRASCTGGRRCAACICSRTAGTRSTASRPGSTRRPRRSTASAPSSGWGRAMTCRMTA
jgi:ferredoxin